MTEETQLNEMFARLRRSSPREASLACEQKVLRRAQKPGRRSAWLYWAAVAACIVVLFGSLLFRRSLVRTPQEDPALAGFVSLPYGQGDAPLEQITILRVNLPPSAPHRQADLLIGQDGVARAVRFVQ